MKAKLKRVLLIAAGTICTAIGIVGIFVPILPTTPFLLLAAACYIRSSPKLYNWLTGNKFLGIYVKNYLEKKGMPLKIKVFTIVLLWIAIGCSIMFAVENPVVRLILIIIAAGVTTHIALIKTAKTDRTVSNGKS